MNVVILNVKYKLKKENHFCARRYRNSLDYKQQTRMMRSRCAVISAHKKKYTNIHLLCHHLNLLPLCYNVNSKKNQCPSKKIACFDETSPDYKDEIEAGDKYIAEVYKEKCKVHSQLLKKTDASQMNRIRAENARYIVKHIQWAQGKSSHAIFSVFLLLKL